MKTVDQYFESAYMAKVKEMVAMATSNIDCNVYLFGSRAKGINRRDSDIDIAVSNVEDAEFLKIRDSLLGQLEDSIVPYHIDIINFDTSDPSFRDIAMDGAVLWKQS